MLDFKELKDINDNYDPESIVLDNYRYIDNNIGDKTSANNCLINSFDVLQKVSDLGKAIFEKYIEISNCTKNDIYKNGTTLGKILVETHHGVYDELINDWLNENGLPYSSKIDINDQKILIPEDALLCYLFSQLHKRLILWKEEKDSYANPDRKQSPKYNIELYLTVLNPIITKEIKRLLRGSQFNEGVIRILLSDENDEGEIYDKLKKITNKDGNYTELIDDNIIFFIRAALISSVLEKIDYKKSEISYEYKVSKTIPIYNSYTKEFRFYEKASSLIGIAWNRLLQVLITTEYGYTRVPCRNEECNNYFVKDGKNQFCDTCRNNGTARKIIYREYNKKRKKQSTSSPQTT